MTNYKLFDPKLDQPQLGAIVGEPDDFYHSTGAIGSSKLKDLRDNPLLYKKKHIDKTIPQEDSDPLIVGRAVHCLALEGGTEYKKRFYTIPEDAPTKPTKKREEYKKLTADIENKLAYWEKLEAENEGKQELSDKNFNLVFDIHQSIHSNDVASELITQGTSEVSFRVDVGWTILQVKADSIIESCSAELAKYLTEQTGTEFNEGELIVSDLKTCANMSQSGIGSFSNNYDSRCYYTQEALYREVISSVLGRPIDKFLWIVAEKSEPFYTKVMQSDTEDIILGVKMLKKELTDLKWRIENDEWYPHDRYNISDIRLSKFKREKLESAI